MTYANGYTETYTYDAPGNMLTVKENCTLMYSYQYDLAGNVLVANSN